MKSEKFNDLLNAVENEAWKSFVAVVQGFLGNNMDDNYAEFVANLVNSYSKMGMQNVNETPYAACTLG